MVKNLGIKNNKLLFWSPWLGRESWVNYMEISQKSCHFSTHLRITLVRKSRNKKFLHDSTNLVYLKYKNIF